MMSEYMGRDASTVTRDAMRQAICEQQRGSVRVRSTTTKYFEPPTVVPVACHAVYVAGTPCTLAARVMNEIFSCRAACTSQCGGVRSKEGLNNPVASECRKRHRVSRDRQRGHRACCFSGGNGANRPTGRKHGVGI